MGRARRLARRRKPAFLLAAVTALLLITAPAPYASASERDVATRADVGDILVSPKPNAFIKGGRARIAFRAPAGTKRLWVRLNDRAINSRFGRSGSLRVATLSAGKGLRYGENSIYVLAKRRGGRKPRVDARSFTFGRRVPGLAQLKLTPGPVTSVGIRAAAPTLTPAEFDSRRRFNKQLNVIRRNRLVRIRLNGRPVTKAFTSPQPTRWNARLSATHGLRHGVNRLRILVAEPETGRYDVLRRSFVVPQGVTLPAAGPDLARPFGLDRMPLDARDSRDDGDGRLAYTWKVLSKPRGSDPELRRADSARPLFDPDRRGRYRVGLHAMDPNDPLAASEAIDLVDLIVPPRQQLLPMGFLPQLEAEDPGGPRPPGIKVGDKFYPAPNDGTFQWLTLDRTTLKPIKTGNTSFDPRSPNGDAQLDALSKAVSKGGHDDLVILAHPARTLQPLNRGQVDQFNSILKLLGAGPIDADSLTRQREQLVIVGVPWGGDGSGWSSDVQVFTSGQPALNGFLMPDSVEEAPGIPRFRFQPEKIEFDTAAGQQTDRSEMKLGGASLPGGPLDDGRADLPGSAGLPHTGASGGFQVVAIDPITFKPADASVDNRTFNTNYPVHEAGSLEAEIALGERRRMVEYLNGLAKRKVLVAVQSIGRVGGISAALPNRKQAMDDAWKDMSKAMQALGANPHSFFTLGCDLSDYHKPVCNFPNPSQAPAGGSYAFLGGSVLKRGEMVESSTSVVTDPTRETPLRETGTLSGFASIRSDGLMKPAVADGSDRLQFEMYDFVFRAPTPWPETKEAGNPEPGKYRAALAYISTCLPQFQGWGPDLRSAYAGNLNLNYTAAKTDLEKLPYPTPGVNPQVCPTWNFKRDPDFERRHYLGMSAELGVELGWLDEIKTVFEGFENAISRSGGEQLVDLKSIGDTIKNTIKPPSATAKIFADIGEFFLLVFEDLALIPTSAASLAFVEAVAAVYQLSTSLGSDVPGGKPLSDKIDERVEDLSTEAAHRLTASAAGLDRIRQVINSDFGRLKALGSVAGSPAYTADTSTMTDRMTQAANQWFSSELMPVAFGVHALSRAETAHGCYITIPAGHLFSKAVDSAVFNFFGDFNVDRFRARYPSPFVIALHDLHDGPEYVPDEDLANSIFHSDGQGGYGVQLHRYVWEQYEDFRAGAPPTNIATC